MVRPHRQLGSYEFGSRLALESIAKERVRAILKFLDMRGIPVSNDERERIEGCTDAEMLEAWVMRAPSVETTAELF
ncbi:hypothetical protein [Glycomyces sp. NRRL B-16210]|uniref:hypothetical protein n=1 Tax=Glycomyces sp. NRRL B-16210 TaxID=1463821 RepID=UPI000691C63A|nr:hypothetical protein [Glycomyces sp. NRRL B-16210]